MRYLFRRQFALYLSCLTLITLADWLFFKQPLGITTALFAAELLLTILLRSPQLLTARPKAFLVLCTASLLIALIEEPAPLPFSLTVSSRVPPLCSHDPCSPSPSCATLNASSNNSPPPLPSLQNWRGWTWHRVRIDVALAREPSTVTT